MNVITLDPGTRLTGVALLHEGKFSAWRLKSDGDILHIVDQYLDLDLPPVDLFVGELPEHYPRSPVDPNDLIKLAGVVYGCAAVTIDATYRRFFTAKKWKGQIPKKKHHVRLAKALEADDDLIDWLDVLDEFAGKSGEDVWDAACLMHWTTEWAVEWIRAQMRKG